MSTIGGGPRRSSSGSGTRKTTRSSSVRRTQKPQNTRQTKAPSDRVKLSNERGTAGSVPDFNQSFGARPSGGKLDLNGGTLQRGAKGDNVKQLQEMLNSKGAKLDVDGKFGPKTEKALKKFQTGQEIKSDGIVGKDTLGKLNQSGQAPAKTEPSKAAEQANTQANAPPEARPQTPGQTIPEAKVGTPLDHIRRSEPLPKPKPGGPQGEFRSRGTGYFPENSAMEGGFKDRKGKDLQTLQDFLSGKSKYVSVAMDKNAGIPYGKALHIKELDAKYADQLKKLGKEHIDFRVVDTGGAFTNRGTSRIDIATANRRASLDPTVNGPLTLKFLD